MVHIGAFALLVGLHAQDVEDRFTKFVDESGQAVVKIRQGVWSMSDSKEEQRLTFVVDGKSAKTTITANGKSIMALSQTPTSMTAVDHSEHTVQRATFPEVTGEPKKEALPPLEEDRFELKMIYPQGLVLRSNPPPYDVNFESKGDREIMLAKVRKKNGQMGSLELTRNAVTKLPILLKVVTPTDGETIIEFRFEKRAVKPEELAISPEEYAGYRELPVANQPSLGYTQR